jgi:hypothetical protein
MAKVVAGHRRYNSACKICDLWAQDAFH